RRVERGQLLQPDAEVVVQPALVVVDEDGTCDVHAVDQDQPLLDAALGHGVLHLRRDVHERHLRGDVERQIFGVGLHAFPPGRDGRLRGSVRERGRGALARAGALQAAARNTTTPGATELDIPAAPGTVVFAYRTLPVRGKGRSPPDCWTIARTFFRPDVRT